MELDVSGIFWGVLLIVYGGEIITIENLSLSAHGYQLLPYFEVFYSLLVEEIW